jgi:hypothetical protein
MHGVQVAMLACTRCDLMRNFLKEARFHGCTCDIFKFDIFVFNFKRRGGGAAIIIYMHDFVLCS